MSTREQLIKARLGVLALAQEIDNVRLACKQAGISKSHFYEIKSAYEKFGSEGLAPRQRRHPRMPNQTPPELEAQILAMTERFPTYSYLRIANQLRLTGVGVSPSAVRAVWARQGLTLRMDRLLWLEKKSAAAGSPLLTEQHIRLLRQHRGRTLDPEQHVEAPHSGHLLCQDTYFVGVIKGVGKIYMQNVIDAHCSLAFGKLYLSKAPITAAEVLNDRVLPFYDEHDVRVEHLLTDNGREFCGRELQHPFEIYLALNQIKHRCTKVHSPETNGFAERFNRTIKEEFFAVAFRKTFYESVDQLQRDLDVYLNFYNHERAHQGYRTRGRTPFQAFLDGKPSTSSQEIAA